MSTPPPGFGAEAQLFTIEVTEEDRREAERSFRYYDRNQDGKIDSEEMGRSRYGSDLPLFDRNRDGVLTLNEMEYRYARRRIDNTQDNRSRSPGEDRRGGDDRRRGGDDEKEANATESADGELKSYRRKSPVERLPEGMPEWFARDDADGDGQVAMKEFSVSWTDAVLAEFNQFDINRDGLITPQECLAAKNQGAVRGGSIGGGPPPSSAPAGGLAVAVASEAAAAAPGASAASAPASGASPEAAKIDPRYYDYFKKVVIKYDANNDGELTPNEWSSMSKNPEAADVDKNGRITIEEFARWQMHR
jgi:Ca2+-binding EF-hand superfamily protein